MSQPITWQWAHRGEKVGEASHPGPLEPNQDDSSNVGSRGTYRWQAPGVREGQRRVSTDRKAAIDALKDWQRKHSKSLDDMSQLALEELCASEHHSQTIARLAVNVCLAERMMLYPPSLKIEVSYPTPEAVVDGPRDDEWQCPPEREVMQIHSIPLHALLDLPLTCQKRIPAASRMAIHEGLSHLLPHAETTSHGVSEMWPSL